MATARKKATKAKAKATKAKATKGKKERARAMQEARQAKARSDAARKGWETRRRRERQREKERRKRSEAARRGWETRRRKTFISRDILATPSAEEAVRVAELAGLPVVRYPIPPTPLPIPPTQTPTPTPSPTPTPPEPFRDEKEETGWIETLVGLGYTVASPDGLAGTASLSTTAGNLADDLDRLGMIFFSLPKPTYARVEWVEVDLDQEDVGALWGSDPVRLADGMVSTYTTHWHTDVGLLSDTIEPIATGEPDRPVTITVAAGYSPRGVRGRKAR